MGRQTLEWKGEIAMHFHHLPQECAERLRPDTNTPDGKKRGTWSGQVPCWAAALVGLPIGLLFGVNEMAAGNWGLAIILLYASLFTSTVLGFTLGILLEDLSSLCKAIKKLKPARAGYAAQFTRYAMARSGYYCGHPAAQPVFQELADACLTYICGPENASRQENRDGTIRVEVYASKLRCTLDDTDRSLPFHRFRVEDLCHGGEMGAFAYALAAEIKSRVGTQFNQRYPTRSIQLDAGISYPHDTDYVLVTFSYSTGDGHFQPLAKW